MRNPRQDPRPGDIFLDDTDDYHCILVREVTEDTVKTVELAKDLDTNKYQGVFDSIPKDVWNDHVNEMCYEIFYVRTEDEDV